jgi:beta-lactamase superfamily II metal-dependent hydrolase
MYDRLSIRMYHVGFGDCFLVRFWKGDEPFTILFDCGSITEGTAQVTKVADDVIAECSRGEIGPRIDLLVATHRHKDHVGGFSNPLWSKVTVGEVWMPWTEDPDDPQATRIRNRQSALALALAGNSREDEPLANRLPKNAAARMKQAEMGLAINALTNEKAMSTLHSGLLGKPPRRFLPEKDATFQKRILPDAPDLSFHILGPSRSEAVIASMNPPSGKGYFAISDARSDNDRCPAFGTRWQISPEQFAKEARPDSFRDDDRKAIEANAEVPFGPLAAALDNAVNNTSLMIMIECGNAMLLFPGDAQWGSWKAIFEDPKGKAILARTTFYKVGHHGSHNATPREFIESVMPAGGVTFFSTCSVKQWPDIPRAPLVQAIDSKAAKWARSDDETKAKKDGFKVESGLYVEWDVPLPLDR